MEDAIPSRLAAQMRFLLEADRLKGVLRTSSIGDGTRCENSAEHSWHVALMAMVLAEHCSHPIDLGKVLQLLTVHDLVEVYAGDTLIYDEEAVKSQSDRETAAADKLFGMLPSGQESYFRSLWQEFEEGKSPEASFARAVDALAPTWLHWGSHAHPPAGTLTVAQVIERKTKLLAPYPELFAVLKQVLDSALARGLIAR
ncbi:HD domain-containing protein [Fimbriimonas ginsengisoli]|uniref:HD domain protein n=1 Tax=Fimbriimonas ginsengisoli Gsoil 348 TaxID=661478 RepID=A0A068NWM9_FIMGI|nr:HD domain-containing protein [Fimbriimonas ginsengisoli]AIE87928.1 HD domain protein [Fimbriimonas ginsengisoli Gsoil 348]